MSTPTILEVDSPQFREAVPRAWSRTRPRCPAVRRHHLGRADGTTADSARVPAVATGSPLTSVPGIFVNNRAGGRLIAEHLLCAGSRSMAIFDGRMPGKPDEGVWEQRTRRAAGESSGKPGSTSMAAHHIVAPGDCHAEDGERAMKQLLARAAGRASDSDLLPHRRAGLRRHGRAPRRRTALPGRYLDRRRSTITRCPAGGG